MTLKFNDLSRNRSVSSINAGHPRAGRVKVWAGGSETHYQLTHFPRAAFLWPSRGQAETLFLQLPLKMDQLPGPHRTSVLFPIRQSSSTRWWQGKVAEARPQPDLASLLLSPCRAFLPVTLSILASFTICITLMGLEPASSSSSTQVPSVSCSC